MTTPTEGEEWQYIGGVYNDLNSWVRTDAKSLDNRRNEIDAARQEAIAAIGTKEQTAIGNFSAQRVTPEMLSESTKQFINASGGGSITNLPDDEDLTVANGVLKLADKPYNSANHSGMGKKILRKNIIAGKNVLTAAMMSAENTIYVIKYDFELAGQIVNMPSNCILKFEGGSLAKGTLHGNGTGISTGENPIFSNIKFYGSWDISFVCPEWFCKNGSDNYLQLKNAIDMASSLHKGIFLMKNKIYHIFTACLDNFLFVADYIDLNGNNATIKVGDIGDYNGIFNVRGNYAHIHHLIVELSETNTITSQTGLDKHACQRTEFTIGSIPGNEESMDADLHDITINNAIGSWQFNLVRVRNAKVYNNTINYTRQVLTYDRTSMYLYGGNIDCHNNKLNGTDSAHTGIEFHGYNINVYNNIIENYANPIYFVNDLTDISLSKIVDNLVLRGNKIRSKKGIMLWFTMNYNIGNVLIEDNIVEVTTIAPVLHTHNTIGAYVFNNMIVRNNRFIQSANNTYSIIQFYPSTKIEAGHTIIKNILIENNELYTNAYNALEFSSGDTVNNYVVENITFKMNRIYLGNREFKFLIRVENKGKAYKFISFEGDKILSNSNILNSIEQGDSLSIHYNNITTENEIRLNGESGNIIYKDCNLNTSFDDYPPSVQTINCCDYAGKYYSNIVQVYATQSTTINDGKKDVILHEGINELPLYDNFKLSEHVSSIDFSNCSYPFSVLSMSNLKMPTINLNDININRLNSLSSFLLNCECDSILFNKNIFRPRTIGQCFVGCKAKEIDISAIDLYNADMNYMFKNCVNLERIKLGICEFKNEQTYVETFSSCSKLKEIYFNKIKLNVLNLIADALKKSLQNKDIIIKTSQLSGNWLSAIIVLEDSVKDSGIYENKPLNPTIGFQYFCTNRQTTEGASLGIMIYHKGNNVWVDALGREVK